MKENSAIPNKKVFNPDVTTRNNTLEQVRLFDQEKGSKVRHHKIIPKKPDYRIEMGNKKRK